MITAPTHRQQERNKKQQQLAVLNQSMNQVIFVHYSCESIKTKSNPRVTSIGVKMYASNETNTFSIHQEAENVGKDPKLLSEQELNFYEKKMLAAFYKLVRKHKTCKWVHWCMKSSTYGFAAIANRFRILGGRPVDIEHQFRYDLYEILSGLYSENFEADSPDGKLISFAKRNGISVHNALSGTQEFNAFSRKDFQKITLSNDRKVNILCEILKRAITESVKVKSTRSEIHGGRFVKFGVQGILISAALWVLDLVLNSVLSDSIKQLSIGPITEWVAILSALVSNSNTP